VDLPADPGVVEGEERLSSSPLTPVPCLVKVDRYGSVSGLVRVRVPLGMLVITSKRSEDPYGS